MKLDAVGKDQRKVVTAEARELLGFIWAIAIKAETISRLQVAASGQGDHRGAIVR
jgi:transposase